MEQFNVTATPSYDAEYKTIWRYKLRAYSGSGTSSIVESNQTWATKAEAEEARCRVNAGDESGLTFALYSDD